MHLIHLNQSLDQLRVSYGYSQVTSEFQKAGIHSTIILSTNALLHLAVAAVVAIYGTKCLCLLCEQITTRVSVTPSFDKSIPRHKCGC
jgi:hypothetical protein